MIELFQLLSMYTHCWNTLLITESCYLFQKIGYDNAALVAKTAHKEGSTLKVRDSHC